MRRVASLYAAGRGRKTNTKRRQIFSQAYHKAISQVEDGGLAISSVIFFETRSAHSAYLGSVSVRCNVRLLDPSNHEVRITCSQEMERNPRMNNATNEDDETPMLMSYSDVKVNSTSCRHHTNPADATDGAF